MDMLSVNRCHYFRGLSNRSGERTRLACGRRRLAVANLENISGSPFRRAAETNRRAACAPQISPNSLRIIAISILISPVLPKAAHGIFDQLNWKMEPELSGKEERFRLEEAKWGGLPDGHVVGKPVPLFPRIQG
jgi:methionyl-tRNA synthetase